MTVSTSEDESRRGPPNVRSTSEIAKPKKLGELLGAFGPQLTRFRAGYVSMLERGLLKIRPDVLLDKTIVFEFPIITSGIFAILAWIFAVQLDQVPAAFLVTFGAIFFMYCLLKHLNFGETASTFTDKFMTFWVLVTVVVSLISLCEAVALKLKPDDPAIEDFRGRFFDMRKKVTDIVLEENRIPSDAEIIQLLHPKK